MCMSCWSRRGRGTVAGAGLADGRVARESARSAELGRHHAAVGEPANVGVTVGGRGPAGEARSARRWQGARHRGSVHRRMRRAWRGRRRGGRSGAGEVVGELRVEEERSGERASEDGGELRSEAAQQVRSECWREPVEGMRGVRHERPEGGE